jgi:stearoyl-CoA desaturase (delta-9 desaturase)
LDIGWAYIGLLRRLRLASVRRAREPLKHRVGQFAPKLATMKQVLGNRAILMREMTILTLAVFHSERATLAQQLPRAALMRA